MHESAAQELVAMVDKPISPGRPSFLEHEHSMNEIFQKLVQSPLVTSAGFTQDQVDNNDCRRLFHQLSRPLLRSILLQTVGVDNYKMICDPERVGGVYLAGLYVEKRQGGFMTNREMARLIEKLEKYKEAIEVYDKCVQNGRIRQSTRRQKVALELARAADDASKGSVSLPFARPLFEGSGESTQQRTEAVEKLIDMLRRRQDPVEPHMEHECTPMMVRSCKALRNGTTSHYPEGHAENTAKSWGLTMACLKLGGIDVNVVCLPIFIACEDVDFNNGQILGTILACSKLDVTGFNVKQSGTHPGGTLSDDAKKTAPEYLAAKCSWYDANVHRSLLDMPQSDPLPPPDPAWAAEILELEQAIERERAGLMEDQQRLAETREMYLNEMDNLAAEATQLLQECDEYLDMPERYMVLRLPRDVDSRDKQGEGEQVE